MDLVKQCSYFYKAMLIPVYLYDSDGILLSCFSGDSNMIPPISSYINRLFASNSNLSCYETHYYDYYGCIKVKNNQNKIVIGPTRTLPYSDAVLSVLHTDYKIEEGKNSSIDNVLCSIPVLSLENFKNILSMIHFTVNKEEQDIDTIPIISVTTPHRCIDPQYYENFIEPKEEDREYNFIESEELFSYIESGNIQRVILFFEKHKFNKCEEGAGYYNDLRKKKNSTIIGLALVSRLALNSGLPPNEAYPTLHRYLNQVESSNDERLIDSLFIQSVLDFTTRISNSKLPSGLDKDTLQIAIYIKENIYEKLTVDSIAKILNFSRSHLSRKFKKAFGLSLSDYMRECKLVESKNLLAYSVMSIGEISNILNFSSQSHFQTAFKKQFGITPKQYREGVSPG